ncbi:tetratricopeptide repeat protein [Altererythrobacter sp. Z27]|uniref:tetratricopeptide repeat protein n=1 Tax=Altererythrobacter sp. Z27 TaxID=3461147 RepID=UPI004043E763
MKLFPLSRAAAAGLALAVVATSPVPAMAQEQSSEARIRKIESEIRALQRQVFPGGDARFFEPEISTAQTPDRNPASTTSTTAVTDILVRLDAIEAQLQSLTAAGEENRNAVALLEERVAALEANGAPAAEETSAPAEEPAATQSNLAAMTGTTARPTAELPPAAAAAPATAASATPAATGPTATRLAGVQAITKPQTEDAGDDEYTYGFRLWEARYFPEAQQQLSLFVEKYPSHWRTTYGRNLLGRAYLDDGKAREAAPWFLRNYQVDKQAARAGDSLLYLAETMIALDDTSRACIALAEFAETYPALATGRLQSQYDSNRQKVKCN